MIGNDVLPGTTGLLQELRDCSSISTQAEGLIGRYERLQRTGAVPMAALGSQEQERDDSEREKHTAGAGGEEELATLAVDQHDPNKRHQELYGGEENITPVSTDIGEAALHQKADVVSRNGVDSGGCIAEQDRAREQEGNDIFALQKRFKKAMAMRAGYGGGRQSGFYLALFDLCLLGIA